jgi:hypothetical protein
MQAWRAAMAIHWMVRDEISQAIPPAFAEFIARAALPYIESNRGVESQTLREVLSA